jgi:hypothetical protein
MQVKFAIWIISVALSSTAALAQESSKTQGVSCIELGVMYAKCAMTVATGLAPRCPSEYDFVKTARCAKNSDFDKGVKLGTEEFERLLRKHS